MGRKKQEIKKDNISISIDKDLRKFATEEAKKEGRSLSGYLGQLIRKAKEKLSN